MKAEWGLAANVAEAERRWGLANADEHWEDDLRMQEDLLLAANNPDAHGRRSRSRTPARARGVTRVGPNVRTILRVCL